MSKPEVCGLCNRQSDKNDCTKLLPYEDEMCHLSCVLEDQDTVGMDADFGDSND